MLECWHTAPQHRLILRTHQYCKVTCGQGCHFDSYFIFPLHKVKIKPPTHLPTLLHCIYHNYDLQFSCGLYQLKMALWSPVSLCWLSCKLVKRHSTISAQYSCQAALTACSTPAAEPRIRWNWTDSTFYPHVPTRWFWACCRPVKAFMEQSTDQSGSHIRSLMMLQSLSVQFCTSR